MSIKVLPIAITLSLDLVSVIVGPLPHLINSLSHILAVTYQTGSKVHHMGAQAGLVSFDTVLSACL